MKKFLLFFALLAVALPSFGQRWAQAFDGPDTSTTTAVTTTAIGLGDRPFYYEFAVNWDEVGTDSCEYTVQVLPLGGSTWIDVTETAVITADETDVYTGSVLGGSVRLRFISTESGSCAATVVGTVSRKDE